MGKLDGIGFSLIPSKSAVLTRKTEEEIALPAGRKTDIDQDPNVGRPIVSPPVNMSEVDLVDPEFEIFFKEYKKAFPDDKTYEASKLKSQRDFAFAIYAALPQDSDRLAALRELIEFAEKMGFKIDNKYLLPFIPYLNDIQTFISEYQLMFPEQSYSFTANDLYLIANILNNPELEGLLHDRQEMIRELEEVFLRNPPLERKVRPESQLTGYSERPDLGSVPNIQLLRAVLLSRSLNNTETLSVLARVFGISGEKGGVIELRDGRAVFVEVPNELGEDAPAYKNSRPSRMYGGILDWHSHPYTDIDHFGPSSYPANERSINARTGEEQLNIALVEERADHHRKNLESENNWRSIKEGSVRVDAGGGKLTNIPGTFGSSSAQDAGDKEMAREFGSTGVVVSDMGDGRFNIDLFYQGTVGEPVIIDLGVYQVPNK